MRYLTIEWLKLKYYKIFWILSILYVLGMVIVGGSWMFLMEFLKNQGASFEGIDPTVLPLYDFPDVWQNMSYIATYFNVFPSFIVVISMTNEFSYRTLRQNIIDGLSREQFLLSKLSLIVGMTLLAMVVVFFLAFFTGLVYAKDPSFSLITQDLFFIPTLGLTVFLYCSFALLVSLLLKRSGFTIVLLFMYTLIFEPFTVLNFEHNPFLPGFFKTIAPYMPVEAINNLIHVPFQKYIFQEIQDYLTFSEVFAAIVWAFVYWGLIYWIVRRKDL
ncbi:MAG TPA: hypothetical protein DDY13_14005 [Cytophagales bacterium]|jgi:ABC-2 type transport system permease protein|nr:hypothetical protein [Cytophagales bacterium]